MSNFLGRMFVTGGRILGQTFMETWQEAGKKAGRGGFRSKAGNISIQEAKKILNIETETYEKEDLHERYETMFKANDKEQGGSVYIQAKVMNAKVRLEEELERMSGKQAGQQQQEQQQENPKGGAES